MKTKTTSKKINFEVIATDILFSGKLNIAQHGVVYREGKCIDDVKKAAERANLPKYGHGRTEVELSYLAGSLASIFIAA